MREMKHMQRPREEKARERERERKRNIDELAVTHTIYGHLLDVALDTVYIFRCISIRSLDVASLSLCIDTQGQHQSLSVLLFDRTCTCNE